MADYTENRAERVRQRIERESGNIFARLPSIYAASRTQSQRLLQIGGGLQVVEWRTLWDLHDLGQLTIRDLASIQRMDHSLLSRALPDMRRKGYVTMRRDDRDGRQTIVELAPLGRKAFETAAPIMRRRREALRELFTEDELKTLVGYLDRLEGFLREPLEQILQKELKE
jgi:DNA-binding MarR family transcriptional regulator